jgi:dipeptidyl aminopeptidase/acylaminoacyl peptidase
VVSKQTIILACVIASILAIYIIGTPLLVNCAYSSFGFNEHVNYESIKKSWEYGMASTETDLLTSDGVNIHIYETVVEDPKGVIVMLSGITGPSVTHFYGQAKLVEKIGFASVLVDARGHGKSDGNKITFGVDDVKDVNATIEYIKKQPQYQNKPIVVMGLSMGAATAINAGSLNDNVTAIIALSPFSSWTDVAIETAIVNGCPPALAAVLKPSVAINGMFRSGFEYFALQPENTIKEAKDKPIFLIGCSKDKIVPSSNHYRLVSSYQGDKMETWIRDSDDHYVVKGDAIGNPFDDTEYCDKILTFLTKLI